MTPSHSARIYQKAEFPQKAYTLYVVIKDSKGMAQLTREQMNSLNIEEDHH